MFLLIKAILFDFSLSHTTTIKNTIAVKGISLMAMVFFYLIISSSVGFFRSLSSNRLRVIIPTTW